MSWPPESPEQACTLPPYISTPLASLAGKRGMKDASHPLPRSTSCPTSFGGGGSYTRFVSGEEGGGPYTKYVWGGEGPTPDCFGGEGRTPHWGGGGRNASQTSPKPKQPRQIPDVDRQPPGALHVCHRGALNYIGSHQEHFSLSWWSPCPDGLQALCCRGECPQGRTAGSASQKRARWTCVHTLGHGSRTQEVRSNYQLGF